MKRKMVNFTKAEAAILFARVSTAEQIKDDKFFKEKGQSR